MRDEPPPDAVPNWLLVQRALADADPTRPAFSCFCSPESLYAITDKTKLTEACFDIYQLGINAPLQNTSEYAPWLDHWKVCARDNTMWVVLQTFAISGAFRYPTAEELRSQTYLSLAAGCKGIFFFIYQTMPKHPQRLEGLVDPLGKPLPIYAPTTVLAKELGKLSQLILTLKPADFKATVQKDCRAGCFVDSQERQVIIVASSRPDASIIAELASVPDATWKDALTGETYISKDGNMRVALRPGSGRVLVKG